jgi:UDP-glucose 4-epimerase
MRYLITGGAGFIGSHLSEALLNRGDEVFVLDDLSTGSVENIRHLKANSRFHYIFDSIMNKHLLAELVDESDVIFHLAAAVGVRLIVESPVRTIETNVHGTQNVLDAASKKKKLVFTASTSEVYGKSDKVPFHEDADLVLGPTSKGRWSYAASKALDEFLALSFWKEKKLPVIVARFFNTVGPRQTGRYGMVLPNFVRQALAGEPITVYGTGQQSRCFCDVRDCVQAVLQLIGNDRAVGEVVNVGSTEEVSIEALAHLVKLRTKSDSPITRIPYDQAYEPGFEDMLRRVPALEKLERLTGFRPAIPLYEIVDSVITYFRDKQVAGMARAVTAAGSEGQAVAGLSAD